MRNDFSALLSGMFAPAGGRQGEIISRNLPSGSENYVYQVYLPPQVTGRTDGQSEKLPLITFLHGIRERGSGGFVSGMFAAVVKQYLKQIPAVVLLPQCRPNRYWSDRRMDEMVIGEIEATAAEFAVDPRRQYLIGVSMGGYGVWHFAAGYRERFAALVSICGGSPLTTADRFTGIAERVRKTPAWLFHGAQDRVVQVSESRNLAAAIKAAGGNIRYTEYENAGHNVWLNALGERDLLPWLFSQKMDS